MQAWREAFSDGESRLLLSPDSDFFKYFRSIPTPGQASAAPAGSAPAAMTREGARSGPRLRCGLVR